MRWWLRYLGWLAILGGSALFGILGWMAASFIGSAMLVSLYLAILLGLSLRFTPQAFAWTIERLGVFLRVAAPGPHLL